MKKFVIGEFVSCNFALGFPKSQSRRSKKFPGKKRRTIKNGQCCLHIGLMQGRLILSPSDLKDILLMWKERFQEIGKAIEIFLEGDYPSFCDELQECSTHWKCFTNS